MHVQDSYTHMYISCNNSLLRLRGRCSWSVPMTGCCSIDGFFRHNRLYWWPSTLTLQCWKLLMGRPIAQQQTASRSGWENYLWSQGVEKSNKMCLSPGQNPRHSSQQTPPHSRALQDRWPWYITLYSAFLKRGERTVREIVYNFFCLYIKSNIN